MKKLLALCFFGLASMGIVACVASPEPTDESSVDEATPPLEEQAICSQGWTCNSTNFYTTAAACNTATHCAGGCYRDYNCNGHCTCP